MHVTSRPNQAAPITLIEHQYVIAGEHRCMRTLVFAEGLVARPVLHLLGRLLAHI